MQDGASRNRFAGKVAIVTGGASGIGQATVEAFCAEGGSVVFLDMDREKGAELEAQLNAAKSQTLFLQGDVGDFALTASVVEKTLAKFGRLDCLLNNAFSFVAEGMDATLEDWRRVFEVGPVAYASLGTTAAKAMRKTGGGAIVNVSSISAFIAQPGRWTYNTAKGAVHTLTKCMALDFAPYGVRVNSVSPGWIWTQEVLKAAGGDQEKWGSVWGKFHMLRRLGEPSEVAAAILFLFSEDASFITAADLPVDGGYQGLGSEGLGESSTFAGSN